MGRDGIGEHETQAERQKEKRDAARAAAERDRRDREIETARRESQKAAAEIEGLQRDLDIAERNLSDAQTEANDTRAEGGTQEDRDRADAVVRDAENEVRDAKNRIAVAQSAKNAFDNVVNPPQPAKTPEVARGHAAHDPREGGYTDRQGDFHDGGEVSREGGRDTSRDA